MERKNVLFLDDVRDPFDPKYANLIAPYSSENANIIWVENYNQFVEFINSRDPLSLKDYLICFDNDLGEGKEGYDCAKYLVNICLDNKIDLPSFRVHSQNPVAKENIISLFVNYKRNFIMLLQKESELKLAKKQSMNIIKNANKSLIFICIFYILITIAGITIIKLSSSNSDNIEIKCENLTLSDDGKFYRCENNTFMFLGNFTVDKEYFISYNKDKPSITVKKSFEDEIAISRIKEGIIVLCFLIISFYVIRMKIRNT